ncbi:hypothetical protein ACFLVP_03650 [Chloroflexota bacterium]
MPNLKYFIGFNLVPGISSAKFIKLERNLFTRNDARHASQIQITVAGILLRFDQSEITKRFIISLDDELAKPAKYNARAITMMEFKGLVKQVN